MGGYGYFDDESREYVITRPDTPSPWINYLGCGDFLGLISNHGAGYSFFRDARLRRLTRFRYNTPASAVGGRIFYIRDGSDFWTPTWAPVRRELDDYTCRHGLGYTSIGGRRRDVLAEQLTFVPLNQSCEVTLLALLNLGTVTKRLRVFSFVEFCLWNAHDDATNFQRTFSTGEVEVEGSTIFHVTEYRERRNHFAFHHAGAPNVGFDTDRESFLGRYGDFSAPSVVERGEPANSVASGWAPIGSFALDVELPPGQRTEIPFLLGYVENPQDARYDDAGRVDKRRARAMIADLCAAGAIDRERAALAKYWDGLLDVYKVESSDPRLDRTVNTWNPYQCMVTFNVSRSASFYESGSGRGIGFRDSNQDILGFVHLVPERARQRILDLASTQLEDGSAYHQYQPLTKKGNHDIGGGFNDDPLWLLLSVSAYTKETGDYGILDEAVLFADSGAAASLLEHCRRSIAHVQQNLGPHGLPLIGRADWNDCLNLNCHSSTPDESFQTTVSARDGRVAESVMIAGLFTYAAAEHARLLDHVGRRDEADSVRRAVEEMTHRVLSNGWDGEWFLRAYDADGRKVGSRECEEGQIFVEPQGLCVMGGIGVESGEARRALDAVGERLATPHGIMLQQPAYRHYRLELGEISSYPPGYKENGGIFCHNNPWIMIAETILGRGDKAFEYYKRICPAYLEGSFDRYRAEPYVYSQMVAGRDAPRFGEAKNSWLTGTAAWNYIAIAHHMLGVRVEHDGLRVSPCIGPSIPRFTIRRRLRGATYHIEVHHRGGGRPRLTVDGRRLEGNVVPFAPEGAEVRIVCNVE